MKDSSNSRPLPGAKLTALCARILSALILGFWGFFIVAHLFGDEGHASRPLIYGDFVGLAAMAAWLLCLAVAWKWEFLGGIAALVAFAIGASVNPHLLSFPFLIVPMTALLFVISCWMKRAGRGPRPASS